MNLKKITPKAFRAFILAAALAGCAAQQPPVALDQVALRSTSERDGYYRNLHTATHASSGMIVTVSTKDRSRLAHTAKNTGKPFAFFVYLRHAPLNASWFPKNPIRVQDPAPQFSKQFVMDRVSPTGVLAYAKLIGQQTFCPGGRVTTNTTAGFSYSSPQAIAAILAANSGAPVRNGIVPKSVKKSPLPVVEKFQNEAGYVVRLRCSLWRM